MNWNNWTDRIFSNQGFGQGKPARRMKVYVHKFSSLDQLKAACAHYDCALIENGNQYVILPDSNVNVLYKQ